MPKFPKQQATGAVDRKKCENILAVKWKDMERDNTVNCPHRSHAGQWQKKQENEPVMKPNIIIDYNINMRLIDKSDMMVGEVECVRKTVKWYRKLFFHLLDIVVLNSYIYYKKRSGKKLPLRRFMYDLVFQIMEKYGTMAPLLRGRAASALMPPDRITGRDYLGQHHLIYIPLQATAQRKARSHGHWAAPVCVWSAQKPHVVHDERRQHL